MQRLTPNPHVNKQRSVILNCMRNVAYVLWPQKNIGEMKLIISDKYICHIKTPGYVKNRWE